MSNEVLGYFVTKNIKVEKLFKKFEKEFNLGIKKIPKSKLFNYPKRLVPKDENTLCFFISDSPNKCNSTYLTDYLDYCSKEKLNSLPKNGKERLKILLDLIKNLIIETKAEKFAFSISECSQIDEIKKISESQLDNQIYQDFEEFAPPNCLYIIEK